MSGTNSTAVKNLLKTIEEDIENFFKEDRHSEADAVYFLEQLNSRIFSTIFTKEEKIEFVAIAASHFYSHGLTRYRNRTPKTLWEKIRFIFSKEDIWR